MDDVREWMRCGFGAVHSPTSVFFFSCLTVFMSWSVLLLLLFFRMCSLSVVVFCVQKGSALVSIVKVVLVVGILFTYPLQLVPVIQALETWMQSDSPFEPVLLSSASSSPGASPRPAPPTDEEHEERGLGTVGGSSHAQTGGEYASCTFWVSGALFAWGLDVRVSAETLVCLSLARIGFRASDGVRRPQIASIAGHYCVHEHTPCALSL